MNAQSPEPPSRRGVVAVALEAGQILLIRRSRHVEAPGMLCFPGGAVEAGETEADALRREMREELGLSIEPQHCLWRSVTSWNVSLAWYLVRLPAPLRIRKHDHEVESVLWVTPDRLPNLDDLLESNLHFYQAWRRGEFRLPGVTP